MDEYDSYEDSDLEEGGSSYDEGTEGTEGSESSAEEQEDEGLLGSS